MENSAVSLPMRGTEMEKLFLTHSTHTHFYVHMNMHIYTQRKSKSRQRRACHLVMPLFFNRPSTNVRADRLRYQHLPGKESWTREKVLSLWLGRLTALSCADDTPNASLQRRRSSAVLCRVIYNEVIENDAHWMAWSR